MTSQTLLAFDVGTKRIGPAVGQSITCTANILNTIPAKEGIPNWDTIEALLKEWQPDTVIVGLPLNMDGTENELCRRAKKFGNRIHGRFRVPVEMFDERLTTREAKELAWEEGHKGNYANDPVDSIAARLILESWWRQHPPTP